MPDACRATHRQGRAERQRHRRVLGRRVVEGEAAADRAAVANGRVRHVRHRLREQRQMLRHHG